MEKNRNIGFLPLFEKAANCSTSIALPVNRVAAFSSSKAFSIVSRVHQAGFPNVVALMGCSLSGQQADLLIRHFAEAALLLDGDEAGERATAKITATLSETMKVYRGRVPQGRQPDELLPAELRSVIEGANGVSQ